MTTPIQVAIVEDHELTRQGLYYSLSQCPEINLVGEANNGLDSLTMVANTEPHVVLMDIGLPQLDGISATSKIKTDFPDVKIIILTSRDNEQEVLAALSAGAEGYCLKDTSIERLMQVISLVAEGGVWLDPLVAEVIVNNLSTKNPKTNDVGSISLDVISDLTERETQVLKELVAGRSNKDIADVLHISLHTVKSHVANIIQKLSVEDRTQAAIKAIKSGFL